ncbi:glutaredoxin family protein [Lysinibacter sp. HNR]|uniref:glutaredoxin family protein n=1 Tax=Lysinibacter sp. HNR TaxID=3031408 RepID=UPI002435A7AB|nr:glutaredoxin family protein [Lysinibacter sp. HNR]WGD37632.1 glutaredoxin family protein [Lysinibacter sp. HNR]
MATTELTLIGKAGCHLCDDARDVVTAVLAHPTLMETGRDFELVEKSILDDEQLFERYVEEIPVLLIDGKVHNYWRIDPERLLRALHAESR